MVTQVYYCGDTVRSCLVAKVISFFVKEYTGPLLVVGSTRVRMSSTDIVGASAIGERPNF